MFLHFNHDVEVLKRVGAAGKNMVYIRMMLFVVRRSSCEDLRDCKMRWRCHTVAAGGAGVEAHAPEQNSVAKEWCKAYKAASTTSH